MRLLETESLETAMLHSGITLRSDVHAFYGEIWQLIKTAEKTPDDAAMPGLEKQLRQVMRRYYIQVDEGLEDAECAENAAGAAPEWRALSVRARQQLKAFERQLQRYVLCYMHLGRVLSYARDEIEQATRDYAHEAPRVKLQVNDMTGMLVARACRQKREMIDKRTRLDRLSNVLEDLQERFAVMREDLYNVLPGVDVERAYIAFRGALRHGRWDEARRLVGEWTDHKPLFSGAHKKLVRENSDRIIALMEDNAPGLKVQDGYMLEQSEIRLLYSFLDGDERRVDQFLRKYLLRFMGYKLRHLLTLAQRLAKVGTLESLLVLHTRLVGGITHPMDDMAQIKRYEQEVVGRAGYLIKNAFPDLPHIFNETETTMDEIRRLFADAHDIGPYISAAKQPL